MGFGDWECNADSKLEDAAKGYGATCISCRNDLDDLRPAADIIIRTAYNLRKRLPENQPLVILMGEEHDISAHNILEQLVLQRALKIWGRDNFTFATEQVRNMWGILAKDLTSMDIPGEIYYNSNDYDIDGRASLSSFLGCMESEYSPVANDCLKNFCYQKGIKTIFNDASRRKSCRNAEPQAHDSLFEQESYLDLDDPLNKKVLEEYRKIRAKNGNIFSEISISSTSREGIAVRNMVMAQTALNHARIHEAPVIIQQVGREHLYGNDKENVPFEESLYHIFNRSGAAVLPVFIITKPESSFFRMPGRALSEAMQHSIVIEGMNQERYYSRSEAELRGISFRKGQEMKFIAGQLNKASGNEIEIYDSNSGIYYYFKQIIADTKRILDKRAREQRHLETQRNQTLAA